MQESDLIEYINLNVQSAIQMSKFYLLHWKGLNTFYIKPLPELMTNSFRHNWTMNSIYRLFQFCAVFLSHCSIRAMKSAHSMHSAHLMCSKILTKRELLQHKYQLNPPVFRKLSFGPQKYALFNMEFKIGSQNSKNPPICSCIIFSIAFVCIFSEIFVVNIFGFVKYQR